MCEAVTIDSMELWQQTASRLLSILVPEFPKSASDYQAMVGQGMTAPWVPIVADAWYWHRAEENAHRLSTPELTELAHFGENILGTVATEVRIRSGVLDHPESEIRELQTIERPLMRLIYLVFFL